MRDDWWDEDELHPVEWCLIERDGETFLCPADLIVLALADKT